MSCHLCHLFNHNFLVTLHTKKKKKDSNPRRDYVSGPRQNLLRCKFGGTFVSCLIRLTRRATTKAAGVHYPSYPHVAFVLPDPLCLARLKASSSPLLSVAAAVKRTTTPPSSLFARGNVWIKQNAFRKTDHRHCLGILLWYKHLT